MYIINEKAAEAAKKRGHAVYPGDFPMLAKKNANGGCFHFVAWKIGADWHIETTLNGDALQEQLMCLE